MSRFYVYALIDPHAQIPRYIGKGNSLRTETHIRQARQRAGNSLSPEALVIGADTADVLAEDAEKTPAAETSKHGWLNNLLAGPYTHADIARIVARDLEESSAFTLESFLLTHVYPSPALLNQQGGHHAERFRPNGEWGSWDDDRSSRTCPWYVYVLRDPRPASTGKDGVFYVGKGSGARHNAHARDAISIAGNDADPERLRKVRELLDAGLSPDEIAYTVARVETEHEAFLIEALLIKFVYGIHALSNEVAGHRAWAIRPKDRWEALPGFDLPRVVDPGVRQDRTELLQILLAEGLATPLEHVRHALADTIQFDDYQVLDSGELGMEGTAGGTRLKIFTRGKKIHLELRPRSKAQRAWMVNRFRALGRADLLRRDGVFIPSRWRGRTGWTNSVGEVVRRALWLIELALGKAIGLLPAETLALLDRPNGIGDEDPDEEIAAASGPGGRRGPPTAPAAPAVLAEPPGDDGDEHLPAVAAPPGDDCAQRLHAVAAFFPDILFDEPRPRDAGEVSIEGLIGAEGDAPGATLKISCRMRGFGLELRARTKPRKDWLHQHLTMLGCTLPRAMNPEEVVFLPDSWKRANIAADVDTVVERVGLLLQIVSTAVPDDLDEEARGLLH